jgi:hypothetical protein
MPHDEGNRVLIIAGMHRSGTSLISQWLNKCGLNIGETLVGPYFSNAEGHFEDVDFYRFHEDVLLSNNLPHTGLTDQVVPELTTYQREKIKNIIAFKNRMYPEWGWKEPRTCLFLPLYQELIPGAFYLIITRDYETVISSLLNRDFKEIEKKYLARKWFSRNEWIIFRRKKRLKKLMDEWAEFYLKVWIRYSEELLKLIHQLPESKYLVVSYEQLIDDDLAAFCKIAQQWRFKLQYVKFKTVFKKELVGKTLNVIPHIPNKSFLEKANQVQEALRNYVSYQENSREDIFRDTNEQRYRQN